MAGPLDGQVAVVTGGGRGIGRAIALRLAADGAAVAVVARTEPEIRAVAKEIEGAGGRAAALACDVTSAPAVRDLPPAVEAALGPVSILVNNAGAGESAPFLKTTDDLWHRMFRVNADSVFHVTQAFLGGMVERGRGRVVNVASIAGKRGYHLISAYCAAKHAVIGLTRAVAAEYARKGITVNAVCPGYVDTPLTDRSVKNITERTARSPEEVREMLARMNPQDRIFTPEEVAALVAALAGDGWRGVNGQAIHLDGGEVQS